jgi:hypothetical protein
MTGDKISGKGGAMKQVYALMLLCGLASCEGSAPAPKLFCPNPAVLEQASSLPLFLPGKQDVGSLVSQATITGVAGSCTLEPEKKMLRVKLQAGFAATNGPADHGAPVVLPYFVAVSQGDMIVAKTVYQITLNFDGNASAASAVSKPVTVEIPNAPMTAGTDVLVGFQMTAEQLAYVAAHPVVR